MPDPVRVGRAYSPKLRKVATSQGNPETGNTPAQEPAIPPLRGTPSERAVFPSRTSCFRRGEGEVMDADDARSREVTDSPADIHDGVPPDKSSDGGDRYSAVRQYSLAQILEVWAAAAVPMGVLAWIVAPWLRDQLGGDEPLARALLICLTLGLIWQFALVLILMRRELGALHWSRLQDALWLRAPRDPKTGRVGGKVWWWALLFVFLSALWSMVPSIPGPTVRDLPTS